jgi:mannose-1-phosphate guanylyltransferase
MLPKQFVRLFDGRSLFQETVLRNQFLCKQSIIVSNVEQYFLAVDQLGLLAHGQQKFLLEPVGRNTAPAIALTCLLCDEDDIVLVTPTDHLVKNQLAYQTAVAQAKELAEQGFLVTFGIQPTYRVLSFKEKPDEVTAQGYLAQGNYYWNSGMFCFKAGVFLAELAQHSPDIYQACVSALSPQSANTHEVRIDLTAMQAIPEDSIDYAVMEKSSKVMVVPCEIHNSDDTQNNAVLARHSASPEPICIDSAHNLIISRDRQIALIDVDDLLIVDTADALLVSKKGSSQKVKQVLAQVKRQSPELAEVHRLAYRPWGTYEVLVSAEQYKVKRIVVKPNAKLSLQKHFHRNEHWVVVSGTATVTVDDRVFLVRPNESTYIQMGQLHRLENQGKIDLVMIEVQVGEYTGEDDIVRMDDSYGRSKK